jgi:hypothetical protein
MWKRGARNVFGWCNTGGTASRIYKRGCVTTAAATLLANATLTPYLLNAVRREDDEDLRLRGYATPTDTSLVGLQEPSDMLDMLAEGSRLAVLVGIKMAAYSVVWPVIAADIANDIRQGTLRCRHFVLKSVTDEYVEYPCGDRWQFAFEQHILLRSDMPFPSWAALVDHETHNAFRPHSPRARD